mgnify:FL=1
MVVSGAGTGKTNLLVGRILNLILEKNVPPSEILALTFTEKATKEMADRLDESLPLEKGGVFVKTFHSFAEHVLRESGHEIGISPDFKILSDADLWMFLKRNLGEFKLNYFRSLGNPFKFLNMLAQYFSRLQDEDILPEKYLEYAEKLEPKAETTEKHLELARAYSIYKKLLDENDFTDFGGLLFNVLRLFEKRKSVLAEDQERFKYILVDEFQDTNFAQNKMVSFLAQKHKNLLIVGDDDQSIYKWRGASLTNIQYFEKLFPGAPRVVLNENYRSNQAILDLAYSVIQHNNPRRLEVTEKIDKRLISATAARPKGKTLMPEIHNFETLEQEIDFVCDKAKSFVKKGLNTAILARTNALANFFVERFRRSAVPYQHFSQSDLFTKPGVKDCIALLRVISDPWDDMALYRFLSLPVWKINMEDLLKTIRQTKFGNKSFFDLLTGDKFKNVKKMLEDLIDFSRTHIVSEILRKFLTETDYLEDDVERMQDIALFADCVREFENTHPEKNVKEFLVYIQMLEESGSRNAFEPIMDSNVIKILTVHGAKGLEFDACFVPGLVQGKFPSINRKEPFIIPDELIEESLPKGDYHVEEERRLFYVAITRARENLILTHSDFYDGKRQWKPSQFIIESLRSGKAVLKTPSKTAKTRAQKSQTELPFEEVETRKHRSIQKIERLSYSQIDAFKACPLKYKFRYLSQIPPPPIAVLNFGSSIHNTLRDFYAQIQADPSLLKKDLIPLLKEIYEQNWIGAGYETRQMQENQKRAGFLMLEKYYMHEKSDFIIPEFLERQFMLEIGDLKLSGRIDRIDKLPDGTYEVIDYKTGSANKDAKNDLQMTVYALACKEVFKIPVSKLTFYFLDELEKVSTTRSEKALAEGKEQILKYADEISVSDFSPTPGFHCGFCEFRLICPVAASITR